MKPRTIAWLVPLLFTFALAPAALAEIPVPEFDGGYIVTRDGELVEMTPHEGGMASNFGDPQPYFLFHGRYDLAAPARQVRGFAIRGTHDFSAVSLAHIMLDRSIGAEARTSGIPVAFRKKSIGPDSYYLQPRRPLPAGDYMLFTEDVAWPFRATGMDCAPKTEAKAPLAHAREWAMTNWGVPESDLPDAATPAEALKTWKLGEGEGWRPEANALVFLKETDDLPGGHVAIVSGVQTSDEEIGDNQLARYLSLQTTDPDLDGQTDPLVCDARWREERGTIVVGEKRYPVAGYLHSPSSFDCRRKQREAEEELWQVMRQVLMNRANGGKIPSMEDLGFPPDRFRWYNFKILTTSNGEPYVRAESKAPGVGGRGAGDDMWTISVNRRIQHLDDGCGN